MVEGSNHPPAARTLAVANPRQDPRALIVWNLSKYVETKTTIRVKIGN